LNFNAAALFTAPYSSLGAGVIVLPTKDPNGAILNLSVMQTNGLPYVAGFSDLDSNKLTFGGEGRVRTDFFGLTGHQVVGAMFSNADFGSINQNVRIIIENRELSGKKGSWNMHYNFDQYLYEPEKGSGEGIGIFGRFGASDGNPNFMHYVYSLGFGGKGVVPNRHNDRYGLGFYYIDVNDVTLEGPVRTRSALRDEYGFEAFYNVAITPWLQLTPDIQVVRGAQKDRVVGVGQGDLGRPTLNKKSVDTAVVLGFRLQVLF
jgi:porin